MPPDRPLSEADIVLIEAWILVGARRNPGGQPAGVTDAAVDAPTSGDASDGGIDAQEPTDASDGGGGQ